MMSFVIYFKTLLEPQASWNRTVEYFQIRNGNYAYERDNGLIQTHSLNFRCRDSAICDTTVYGLDEEEVGVPVAVGLRIFFARRLDLFSS
jgi:hypothetical protein